MSEIKWIKLSVNMFDDEKIKLIRSMPEGDSIILVWIQLLSLAGKTNDDGMIYIGRNLAYSDEMMATIFDHPLSTIRLALRTLESFDLIEINPDGVVRISNWEKHQSTDKMARMREQNRLRKRRYDLRNKVRELGYNPDDKRVPDEIEELEKYVDTLEKSSNVTETLRNDTEVRSKKLEVRSKKLEVRSKKDIRDHSPKPKKRVYEDNSEPYKLAIHLFEKMKVNNPEVKEPNFQNWADDMRKTMELDKRTFDQVNNMIDWCQSNDFWSGIILSPKKLREKYDQMRVQANNDYKKTKSYSKPSVRKESLPEWAESNTKVKDKPLSAQEQAEFQERLKKIREQRNKGESK